MVTGQAVAFALDSLQERGDDVRRARATRSTKGMIVGENARDNDMAVNPTKEKKLTNMRASGRDKNILLKPPRMMTLEIALEYIEDDELVEVTPVEDPPPQEGAQRGRPQARRPRRQEGGRLTPGIRADDPIVAGGVPYLSRGRRWPDGRMRVRGPPESSCHRAEVDREVEPLIRPASGTFSRDENASRRFDVLATLGSAREVVALQDREQVGVDTYFPSRQIFWRATPSWRYPHFSYTRRIAGLIVCPSIRCRPSCSKAKRVRTRTASLA